MGAEANIHLTLHFIGEVSGDVAVDAAAAVPFSLFDPAMDRRRAPPELPGQIFHAASGSGQRNYLLPEFRRVRVPRSRHRDTLLS